MDDNLTAYCGYLPNRTIEVAFALAAPTSRFRGSALVTNSCISNRALDATSATARSKAASLALDGTLKPLSLRTN